MKLSVIAFIILSLPTSLAASDLGSLECSILRNMQKLSVENIGIAGERLTERNDRISDLSRALNQLALQAQLNKTDPERSAEINQMIVESRAVRAQWVPEEFWMTNRLFQSLIEDSCS